MCGHAKRQWEDDLRAAADDLRSALQEARANARASRRAAASATARATGGPTGDWGRAPSPAPDRDPEPDPNLLIGDRERERVIDALKQATADGRLTMDEFGERVGEAYAARTIADLRHVLRQLPENVRAAAEPPRPVAPAPPPDAYGHRHHDRRRRHGMHPMMVTLLVALVLIALTGGEMLVLLPFFWLLFMFRRFTPRRS